MSLLHLLGAVAGGVAFVAGVSYLDSKTDPLPSNRKVLAPGITRMYDAEYGIVCYTYNGLSCLKVEVKP